MFLLIKLKTLAYKKMKNLYLEVANSLLQEVVKTKNQVLIPNRTKKKYLS